MSEVRYSIAVRVFVDESEEQWQQTSCDFGEEDFSGCATVHEIALKLSNSVLRHVSVPTSPIAMDKFLSAEADYGIGYARVSVKYVGRSRGEILKASAMVFCDGGIPVIPQAAIPSVVTKIINGKN